MLTRRQPRYVAAKLGLGYTLPQLANSVTKTTTANVSDNAPLQLYKANKASLSQALIMSLQRFPVRTYSAQSD